jgi:hypothetical protein
VLRKSEAGPAVRIILHALAWKVHFGRISENNPFFSQFFSVCSTRFHAFCGQVNLESGVEGDTIVYADLLACFCVILRVLASNQGGRLAAPFLVRALLLRLSHTFAHLEVHFDPLLALAGDGQKQLCTSTRCRCRMHRCSVTQPWR